MPSWVAMILYCLWHQAMLLGLTIDRWQKIKIARVEWLLEKQSFIEKEIESLIRNEGRMEKKQSHMEVAHE